MVQTVVAPIVQKLQSSQTTGRLIARSSTWYFQALHIPVGGLLLVQQNLNVLINPMESGPTALCSALSDSPAKCMLQMSGTQLEHRIEAGFFRTRARGRSSTAAFLSSINTDVCVFSANILLPRSRSKTTTTTTRNQTLSCALLEKHQPSPRLANQHFRRL